MSDVLSEEEMAALNSPDEAPVVGSIDTDKVVSALSSTVGVQGSVLSGVTVSEVVVNKPEVNVMDRNSFTELLSDEVFEIKADFTKGVPGEHLYVINSDVARRIATTMIGQEDLELDETSTSALNETFSQLIGSITTSLSRSLQVDIETEAPSGQVVPKGTLGVPNGSFAVGTYTVSIDDQSVTFYQVLGSNVANGLNSVANNILGRGQNAQAGNSNVMNAYNTPPEMQNIGLGSLNVNLGEGEQRNISLLMDVEMELTVELGRTKWLIKDILQLGEGTIIELDKLAGEPIFILVNGNPIARGEVLVIDENFAVRVTDIVPVGQRMLE